MFAQWDELFISEYWLCHPPICAASPDIWTPNIGRWVISENNKDVTGVMLDDDNNTNILITDSWLWWQWWLHSWVSSQPLWSWAGMWPVYCDMILFVTEVSPSQWVISTSVMRCDTVHFISELEKCHAIIGTQSLTFTACCIRKNGAGFLITVTCRPEWPGLYL